LDAQFAATPAQFAVQLNGFEDCRPHMERCAGGTAEVMAQVCAMHFNPPPHSEVYSQICA
jgi:hypothetical protein